MKCFGMTDKGTVRNENQDCFKICECDAKNAVVVALCDGMGGAKAGGIASDIAINEFTSYVYARLTSRTVKHPDFSKVLPDACNEANKAAYEYSQFDEAYNGMGTTLVGGVIKSDGNGYIINVGDSRAYHISSRNQSISQISKDHSLVEELVDVGILTREQARKHPHKNVITRALGAEETVESDYYEFSLMPSDVLLLCSDGLSNVITESEMLEYAGEYQEPELLCGALMSKALKRGANDNVTVVAVMR